MINKKFLSLFHKDKISNNEILSSPNSSEQTIASEMRIRV
jgi:hypothetical protein